MTFAGGTERVGRIRKRIDGRPVLGPSVVPRKKCVLPVGSYRSNGSLDTIVIDLDAPIGQKELQAIPVFDYVSQGLANWGLIAIRAR